MLQIIFWSLCAGYPSNVSSLTQAVQHRVLVTPYLLNLIAVEQLKPLISAVEVYPRVSIHRPQLPESYQLMPSAWLHPGQSMHYREQSLTQGPSEYEHLEPETICALAHTS